MIFYYTVNNINQTATTNSTASNGKTKIRRNSSGLFLLN